MVRNAEVIESMGLSGDMIWRWHEASARVVPAQVAAADQTASIMSMRPSSSVPACRLACLGLVPSWCWTKRSRWAQGSLPRPNIARLGKPDPEAVFEAARLARCHEMILRPPQDNRSEIGDGGTLLSAGQHQKIGLARAQSGRLKRILLNEPNSNLDGDGEAALLTAVERPKPIGTTVVRVSHRPILVQVGHEVPLPRERMVEMYGPRAEILKRLVQWAGPAAGVAPTATSPFDDRKAGL